MQCTTDANAMQIDAKEKKRKEKKYIFDII